jgi:hypothetical protein
MTNNKQQTAVEMMWNEIDNLFPYKDSVEAQKFCAILDKYKEMEKEKMIEFAQEVFRNRYNQITQSLGNIADDIYNETYGGGNK